MEQRRILDQKWRFNQGDVENAFQADFNDDKWEEISLPHTWNAFDVQSGGGTRREIYQSTKAAYLRGVGWYRTVLKIPSKEDKRYFVFFEAAGSVAHVYLNGTYLGQHLGAFSAFCYEITPHVKFGEDNLLAVKVDNSWREDLPPLGGDFPVMGGLYRQAHLIEKERTCITPLDHASPGIYLKQVNVTDELAEVEVTTKISNMDKNLSSLTIKTSILAANGAEVKVLENEVKARFNQTTDIVQNLTIEKPHLWNGRVDPYLYEIRVELCDGETLLDVGIQPLGLRYYHIDPKKGFFLNGKSYKIKGVCRHQDRFNKGWALSQEDQDEDLSLMIEMGVNGVRLAHYQHSDYFHSICDKNGILVWAELAIVNKVNFEEPFLENSKSMLTDLIRQNYNHPSIFTWSLANEIGLFQRKSPVPVMEKLNDLAHEEDLTRPTILAAISVALFRKDLHNLTDIIGWNHYAGWYYFQKKPSALGKHMKRFNKVGNYRGLCMSEYGAGASIHHHVQNMTHEDKVKTTGNFHPEEKQNLVHEANYKEIKAASFVWGSFLWNMFDFAVAGRNEGDTPGRNDKGLVTYDRKVKKDAYFFYKANWTEEPMVYITSRRHLERVDPSTEIKVYSNCNEVELKVNGKPIGTMTKEELCIFRWLNYELSEGENNIEVVGIRDSNKTTDSCVWKLIKG